MPDTVRKVSAAQRKATDKYLEKFEELRARVPKGQKDAIKAHADKRGESVNSFIGRAIAETMARDAAPEGPQQTAGTLGGGGVILSPSTETSAPQDAPTEAMENGASAPAGTPSAPLPPEVMEAAQAAAEATGEAVPDFIRRAVESEAKRDRAALRMGTDPATGKRAEG